MRNIQNLYPQYKYSSDRRQQNIPVAVERRSGNDRRSNDRVTLDTKLTKDIFDVKSQISKIEAIAPKLFSDRVTTQAPTFASMNNFNQDQLVKETKPDPTEIARQEAELQDKASTSFQVGIIAAALAGAIALSFMGTAGAVMAIGTGLYIGARIIKTLIAREIGEEDKTK